MAYQAKDRLAQVTLIVFVVALFGLTAADLIIPSSPISLSERRKLAEFPNLTSKSIIDGSFTIDYAAFLKDQIICRDGFRALKAFVELYLLRKGENNGVYIVDGSIYDKFYGINQSYIDRAAELMNAIIDAIDSEGIYLSIIPSKAFTLHSNAYLLSDQGAIADDLRLTVEATYIDVMDYSQYHPELYYRTDHHWRTQGAIEIYKVIIAAMGFTPYDNYSLEEVTDAYAGSNYGRAALPFVEKDSIVLAHNATIDALTVCRYTTAEACDTYDSVYFKEKANSLDPYDVFLGGASPIIVINNEGAQNNQELVIFKDSYSHALAPFMAQHFRKVTMIDLRYVRKELIFQYFDLDGKPVLFLYSTTILNTDPKILN